jgi:hypothetical protein
VLDAYVSSSHFIFYSTIGMWLLAPVAFLLSLIGFLVLGFANKINFAADFFDFLCSILGWALAGIGIALVIIFVISAYTWGSQAPFAFILLDGPLGAGVGTIVGCALWLLRIRDCGQQL